MSIVRFATICDICRARSDEYTAWPMCRECGEDICPKCEQVGQCDDENGDTLCLHCSMSLDPENGQKEDGNA